MRWELKAFLRGSAGAVIMVAAVSVLLLSGCGSQATAGPARLDVNTTAVVYPGQLVGRPPVSQTVVFSNGGETALSLASVALGGSGAGAFSLANQCTAALNPGSSCTVAVSFSPAAAGTFAATLTATGSNGLAASVALSGSGVAAVVPFSDAQLTFPTVDVGYASDPIAVQLNNTASTPLAVSSLTVSGMGASSFSLHQNSCPDSLAAGAQCTAEVTFTPAAAVSYTALLSLPQNAGTAAHSLLLAGTGTAATPLSAWMYAYQHCRAEPVNVLVLGDSRSIVDTTIEPGVETSLAATFGQKWPDRLMTTLQAACGSHGSGLVPFLALAQGKYLNLDYYDMQGSWQTSSGLGPQQFGGVPANMLLQTTSQATIQFHVAQAFDHLNAYCVTGPGLNPWTMLIDGSSVGTCGGTASVTQAVLATSSAVALGAHTASLVCSTAPCSAYGMEAVAGTSGISVHNLSVGACAAECFGADPASELAFSDLIPEHHLVVIELLTNDPGVGYSTDSYAAALGNIIQHERARPGTPAILMYAPLLDNISGQAPYYPVLASVAAAYDTAFFDLRATYGYGDLPQYFGPDGAHENNEGHALVFASVLSTLTPTR